MVFALGMTSLSSFLSFSLSLSSLSFSLSSLFFSLFFHTHHTTLLFLVGLIRRSNLRQRPVNSLHLNPRSIQTAFRPVLRTSFPCYYSCIEITHSFAYKWSCSYQSNYGSCFVDSGRDMDHPIGVNWYGPFFLHEKQ